MQPVITSRFKDPLGVMLLDYLQGKKDAFVEVESSTLSMSLMTAKHMFRTYSEMDELEQTALDYCRGNILDVGAGSGCHSLYLEEKGLFVDALDISPGCVETMRQRGLVNVIHDSFFNHDSARYDTILMLMNGIGLCGSIDGLNLFFQYLPSVLKKSGQLLVDSTDLCSLFDEVESDTEDYLGETVFQMKYNNIISEPFGWLYLDFSRLEQLSHYHGFYCELLFRNERDQFLARISSR